MKFHIILIGLFLSIFLFVGKVEAGAPAIWLKVTDTADPLYLSGDNETVYIIEVTNQGTALDKNIAIRCEFPPELQVLEAKGSTRATIIPGVNGSRVTFKSYPVLNPKRKIKFTIRAKGVKAGDAHVLTYLTSASLPREIRKEQNTHIYNNVVSVPALKVDVLDTVDPLFVSGNDETTYVIDVINRGTASDRNIAVRCEFPASLNILEADGTTPATIQGKRVTFDPYRVLYPRQAIHFKVLAKGVKPGEAPVKIYVNSDSLHGREILEEEWTLVYGNEPIQKPVIEPVQKPKPIPAPVQKPVIEPVQKPKPIPAPVQKPVIEPVQKPKPIPAPVQKPVIEPVQKPKPISAPVQRTLILTSNGEELENEMQQQNNDMRYNVVVENHGLQDRKLVLTLEFDDKFHCLEAIDLKNFDNIIKTSEKERKVYYTPNASQYIEQSGVITFSILFRITNPGVAHLKISLGSESLGGHKIIKKDMIHIKPMNE